MNESDDKLISRKAEESVCSDTPSPNGSGDHPILSRIGLASVLGAAAIFVLTVVTYIPALHNGFIWDDDDYVTENQTLLDLNGLRRIWFEVGAVPQYYPLVHTTFWIEHHLWGLNPLGYHLVNVLLHSLGAVLLWLTLKRLKLPGAWLAAAIFALHPVQVESVAWITERKNVLSGLFYFAAALAYLRFVELGDAGVTVKQRWRQYACALIFFIAALLSKTVTCSLPAALLLVRWWKKGTLRREDVLPLLPFFIVGLASGLLTAWVEKHNVGAQGSDWAFSFLERCLIAGRVLWFYAGKLALPMELTFIYPRWEISTSVWWQWFFPISAAGVVVALWLWRHRIGRAPLVGVLVFAGTLVPALGFVNVYPMRFSFVADHFQYLANVGLIALFAAGVTGLAARWRLRGPIRWIPLLILLFGLAGMTWRQERIYRDAETLWRDTLAKNPAAWMAHNNLGLLLKRQGNMVEAEEHLREAHRLKPANPDYLNNLGQVLANTKRYAEAIDCYETGLRLNPASAFLHYNYADALFEVGRVDEAIDHYGQALKYDPQCALAHDHLGIALLKKGMVDEAISHFLEEIRSNPGNADAHNDLGGALFAKADLPQAIAHYREALKLKPDYADAHNNLGLALASLGKADEAMGHYVEALRSSPNHALAHNNLADALLARGRKTEAKTHYLATISANSENAKAHYQLGVILADEGDKAGAISHLREAVRLQPDSIQLLNGLAWLRATAADSSLRNGAEAVQLSERAARLTEFKNPFVLDTLAAAYAEDGHFKESLEAARKAIDLAGASGSEKLAAEIRVRLENYKSGQPWRE